MPKILHRNQEQVAREVDKSVREKWKWTWLEEEVEIKLKNETERDAAALVKFVGSLTHWEKHCVSYVISI